MIDTDRRYKVRGWSGIAWTTHGHPKVHQEPEWVYVGPYPERAQFDDNADNWVCEGGCDIEWYGDNECSCPFDESQVVCVTATSPPGTYAETFRRGDEYWFADLDPPHRGGLNEDLQH